MFLEIKIKGLTVTEKLAKLREPLKAYEVEVRVAQVTSKGAFLLLYKTARVDKARLNESGIIWKNNYEFDSVGNLKCVISYYDERIKEWVSREDIGAEPNTKGDSSMMNKGNYSDAFKRAGFNLGIGDELYNFPRIWINYPTKESGANQRGKTLYSLDAPFGAEFEVREIASENGIGTKLVIYCGEEKVYDFDANRKEKVLRIYAKGKEFNNKQQQPQQTRPAEPKQQPQQQREAQKQKEDYIALEKRMGNIAKWCSENGVELTPLLKEVGLSPTGQGLTKAKVDNLGRLVGAKKKEVENAKSN